MDLKPNADGLLPVVVQHALTGQVLMLAYTTPDLLQKSLDEGRMWFWSRSRCEPWLKGSTSGNLLDIASVSLDCDGDTILASVFPRGPACHTGEVSCFHRPILEGSSPGIMGALMDTIESRKQAMPEGSYTVHLFREGEDAILRKVSEEACEVVLASKSGSRDDVVWEVADLLYHVLVLLAWHGVSLEEVLQELSNRAGTRASEG